jgi:hypothetical protein
MSLSQGGFLKQIILESDFYWSIFTFTFIRDKKKTMNVSENYRATIIMRLKKSKKEYDEFCSKCPKVSADQFSLIESLFRIRIIIWTKKDSLTLLATESSAQTEYEDCYLLCKFNAPKNAKK